MDKSFLFMAAVLFITDVRAQDSVGIYRSGQPRNHEINIGFIDLFTRNTWNPYSYWYLYDIGDYYDWILLDPFYGFSLSPVEMGIGYKFHASKVALRLYIEGGRNSYKFENEDENANSLTEESNTFSSNTIGVRGGAEYTASFRKFHFFAGGDFLYQIMNQDWSSSFSFISYTGSFSSWSESSSSLDYSIYGADLVIGFRYYLSEYFSLSTETRTEYIFYEMKGTQTSISNNNPTISEDPLKASGDRFRVHPIGLVSVNVHL